MAIAMFYHLTRSPPEATLAALLPRATAASWRVMVRGTDPAALAQIDQHLWTDPPESFLPHGMQGGGHDGDQPILLGQGAATNAPQALALIHGAEPLPGEETLERIWVLFDGANEPAIQAARTLWTRLTNLGMAAQYWSEETGRWVMKREKSADKPGSGP